MRSIAIPVADRTECGYALDVAFRLGSHLGADVVGYHMRPSKKADSANSLAISSVWGNEAWPEQDEKDLEAGAIAAGRLFGVMAGQHDYTVSRKHGTGIDLRAIWREKLGTPDKLMPLIGPVNDLLVVSRPTRSGGRKAWLILMSALLDSGVPVLVLPQKKIVVPCKHVAVAWNRGPQEARAVHAALPLLVEADRVTLVTVGKDYKHGPSAREMADYLRCHGVNAEELNLPTQTGPAGPALVQAAKKVGADVLLSGGYTKGRIRQMFFGGVTEHLVWGTSFPVILMHS
jgi:nucleotide-binding universal stress UspA family protein